MPTIKFKSHKSDSWDLKNTKMNIKLSLSNYTAFSQFSGVMADMKNYFGNPKM